VKAAYGGTYPPQALAADLPTLPLRQGAWPGQTWRTRPPVGFLSSNRERVLFRVLDQAPTRHRSREPRPSLWGCPDSVLARGYNRDTPSIGRPWSVSR
jgi:hypothetical protein